MLVFVCSSDLAKNGKDDVKFGVSNFDKKLLEKININIERLKRIDIDLINLNKNLSINLNELIIIETKNFEKIEENKIIDNEKSKELKKNLDLVKKSIISVDVHIEEEKNEKKKFADYLLKDGQNLLEFLEEFGIRFKKECVGHYIMPFVHENLDTKIYNLKTLISKVPEKMSNEELKKNIINFIENVNTNIDNLEKKEKEILDKENINFQSIEENKNIIIEKKEKISEILKKIQKLEEEKINIIHNMSKEEKKIEEKEIFKSEEMERKIHDAKLNAVFCLSFFKEYNKNIPLDIEGLNTYIKNYYANLTPKIIKSIRIRYADFLKISCCEYFYDFFPRILKMLDKNSNDEKIVEEFQKINNDNEKIDFFKKSINKKIEQEIKSLEKSLLDLGSIINEEKIYQKIYRISIGKKSNFLKVLQDKEIRELSFYGQENIIKESIEKIFDKYDFIAEKSTNFEENLLNFYEYNFHIKNKLMQQIEKDVFFNISSFILNKIEKEFIDFCFDKKLSYKAIYKKYNEYLKDICKKKCKLLKDELSDKIEEFQKNVLNINIKSSDDETNYMEDEINNDYNLNIAKKELKKCIKEPIGKNKYDKIIRNHLKESFAIQLNNEKEIIRSSMARLYHITVQKKSEKLEQEMSSGFDLFTVINTTEEIAIKEMTENTIEKIFNKFFDGKNIKDHKDLCGLRLDDKKILKKMKKHKMPITEKINKLLKIEKEIIISEGDFEKKIHSDLKKFIKETQEQTRKEMDDLLTNAKEEIEITRSEITKNLIENYTNLKDLAEEAQKKCLQNESEISSSENSEAENEEEPEFKKHEDLHPFRKTNIIRVSKEENKQLKIEIEKITQNMKFKDEEMLNLRTINEEKQKNLTLKDDEINNKTKIIKKLEEINTDKEKEINNIKKVTTVLLCYKEQLKNNIEKLEEMNTNKEKEINSINKNLKEKEIQLNNILNEKNTAEESILNLKNNIKKLEEMNTNKENEINNNKKVIKSFLSYKEQLENNLGELKEINETNKKKIILLNENLKNKDVELEKFLDYKKTILISLNQMEETFGIGVYQENIDEISQNDLEALIEKGYIEKFTNKYKSILSENKSLKENYKNLQRENVILNNMLEKLLEEIAFLKKRTKNQSCVFMSKSLQKNNLSINNQQSKQKKKIIDEMNNTMNLDFGNEEQSEMILIQNNSDDSEDIQKVMDDLRNIDIKGRNVISGKEYFENCIKESQEESEFNKEKGLRCANFELPKSITPEGDDLPIKSAEILEKTNKNTNIKKEEPVFNITKQDLNIEGRNNFLKNEVNIEDTYFKGNNIYEESKTPERVNIMPKIESKNIKQNKDYMKRVRNDQKNIKYDKMLQQDFEKKSIKDTDFIDRSKPNISEEFQQSNEFKMPKKVFKENRQVSLEENHKVSLEENSLEFPGENLKTFQRENLSDTFQKKKDFIKDEDNKQESFFGGVLNMFGNVLVQTPKVIKNVSNFFTNTENK